MRNHLLPTKFNFIEISGQFISLYFVYWPLIQCHINSNLCCSYILGCGPFHWSMLDLPETTPLKKADSPSAVCSSLVKVMGFWIPSHSMLECAGAVSSPSIIFYYHTTWCKETREEQRAVFISSLLQWYKTLGKTSSEGFMSVHSQSIRTNNVWKVTSAWAWGSFLFCIST